MFKLTLPVKDIYVTQPFGANYLDFYKKWGLKGHNGVDLKTKTGCPVRATYWGTVVYAGYDTGGGNTIIIWHKDEGYKSVYYHLSEIGVKKGQKVQPDQVIGKAGNTGKYTTGPHLHYGLKMVDPMGHTLNWDNGYKGAIDPTDYFPKDWEKTPAYKRYGRKQNYLAEFWQIFTPIKVVNTWTKNGRHIQNILKQRGRKHLTVEENNALIYGGWSLKEVLDPALYTLWAYRKKHDDNHNNIFKR